MKLFIPIILGTTRHGRESRKVATFVNTVISEKFSEDIETELIDVSTLNLADGEDGDLEEKNTAFIASITRADGYIIVAPEYNHSFPGSLKSALDICYDEYDNKAVGFVGVSSGAVGGARMIEHLVGVAKTLGLKCVKKDLLVGTVGEAFKEDDTPTNPKLAEKTEKLARDVLWLTTALKTAREK